MLRVEDWMDIKTLHREGHSIREIAALTGAARNTVRRVLREAAPHGPRRPMRGSKLDPYKPYLLERLRAGRLTAVRLVEELGPQGYTGSVDLVQRFLKAIRVEQRLAAKATVRFETPPGLQAQADWKHVGRYPLPDGTTLAVSCFVMVLSFSRLLYVAFTTDQQLPTLLRCHQEAFAFFGGIPQRILYDNMKQVKLLPGAPGAGGEWNPLFLDFCGHYGIVPATHRVRRPRTKGKVERAIGYVQDSFLAGRTFADLADLSAQGHDWLARVANVRVHATTGARPVDLWDQERPSLLPLAGVPPYQLAARHERTVDAEGYVRLERSRYSVPPEYVGRPVVVVRTSQAVVVRCGDVVVAEHPPAPRPGSCVAQPAHVEALARRALAGPPPVAAGRATATLCLGGAVTVATTPLSIYEALAGAVRGEGQDIGEAAG